MGIDLFNGWIPHASQRKFLESRSRYICFAGQVGPGKTTALCWKAFWLSMNYPRNLGYLGRWVEEHLYDTTLASWKECFPIEKFGNIMRYIGGETEPKGIEIAARDPNNPELLSWDYKSTIKLVPLSKSSRWPGGQLGFFAIDQAEQIPEVKTWTDLMRRLRRKNVPYADQHGFCTANYEANWDWMNELFNEHKIENRTMPEEEASKFECIESLPEETDKNFGPGYRKEQMAVLPPLQAKTLIQGINVRTIGRVYKPWNEDVHVRNFEFEEVEKQYGGLSFVMGYDYGMEPDPTAVVFIGVDRQGRCWVRAEHIKTDTTIKDDTLTGKPGHETLIKDIAARIGFPIERSRFVSGWDSFGKRHTGLRIVDEWSRMFHWTPANCDNDAGIMRVLTLLTTCPKKMDGDENDLPLLIVHKECEQLRYSMSYYKYSEDGSGKPAKKQVPGIKDVQDALRMAVMDAVTPHEPIPVKSSILTVKSYADIIKRNKQGRREGFWVPVIGGVDPASERPRKY